MSIINLDLLVTGLLIVLYVMYVAKKAKQNPAYKAVCDISDKVNCSKFFISGYTSYNGIPFAPFMLGFYVLLIGAEILVYSDIVLWGSGFLFVAIAMFTVIAHLKVKTTCLTCYASLLVTGLLFLGNYLHWW